MTSASAEQLLRRAVSEPNEIRDLAEMILKTIFYHRRNIVNNIMNLFHI